MRPIDEEMQKARDKEKQKMRERLRKLDLGELVSEFVSLEIDFNNHQRGEQEKYGKDTIVKGTSEYNERKSALVSEIGRREDHYLPQRAI